MYLGLIDSLHTSELEVVCGGDNKPTGGWCRSSSLLRSFMSMQSSYNTGKYRLDNIIDANVYKLS